jgi:hypothetical protein
MPGFAGDDPSGSGRSLDDPLVALLVDSGPLIRQRSPVNAPSALAPPCASLQGGQAEPSAPPEEATTRAEDVYSGVAASAWLLA